MLTDDELACLTHEQLIHHAKILQTISSANTKRVNKPMGTKSANNRPAATNPPKIRSTQLGEFFNVSSFSFYDS